MFDRHHIYNDLGPTVIGVWMDPANQGHVLLRGRSQSNIAGVGPASLPFEIQTDDGSAPGIVLSRLGQPDAAGIYLEAVGGVQRLLVSTSDGRSAHLIDSLDVFDAHNAGIVPGSGGGDDSFVLCGDQQWRYILDVLPKAGDRVSQPADVELIARADLSKPAAWWEGPFDYAPVPALGAAATWSYTGDVTFWDASKIADGDTSVLAVRVYGAGYGSADIIADLGAVPDVYINRFRVDFTEPTTYSYMLSLSFSDDGMTWTLAGMVFEYRLFSTWPTDAFFDVAYPVGNVPHRYWKIGVPHDPGQTIDISEITFYSSTLSPNVDGWAIYKMDWTGSAYVLGDFLFTVPKSQMPTRTKQQDISAAVWTEYDVSLGRTTYHTDFAVLAYNGAHANVLSPMTGPSWSFSGNYDVYETRAVAQFEQLIHIEPQVAPSVAPAGTANIVVDAADSKAKLSVSGSAYSRLATFADIPGAGVGLAPAVHTYTAGTIGLTTGDCIIFADATSGDVVLNLQAVASCPGTTFFIKRIDASAHAVTINRYGADTIDGGTSLSLTTRYQAVMLAAPDSGSDWGIF